MASSSMLMAQNANFQVPDEKELLKQGKSGNNKGVNIEKINNNNKHFEKNMKKGSTDPQFAAMTIKKRDIDESKDYLYVYKSYSIRAEANEKNEELLARIPMGSKIELVYLYEDMSALKKEDFLWARVKTAKGITGFMPMKYLKKEKPQIIVRDRDVFLRKPIVYYVIANNLYMRDEADQDSYSLTLLKKNAKLVVTKYSDDTDYIDGKEAKWAYGKADGYEGWVFAGYLSKEKQEDYSDNSEKKEDSKHIFSGSSKYVKAKILHLRDEPSKFGSIIGAVKFKTEVKVTVRRKTTESISGRQSIWVQIEAKVSSSTIRGWVFGGFLTDIKGSYVAYDDIDKPFIYPLGKHGYMTSPYGMRTLGSRRHFHTGQDIGAGGGTPIYAAGDGVVYQMRNFGNRGYGKWTMLEHSNGLYTSYSHQSRYNVKAGQKVKAGDLIGYVGTTGHSTGNHLHFEVRQQPWGKHFNPKNYLVLPEK